MLQVDRLWRALGSDLRAYLSRRISDPAAVEDLLQDVFLRVHARAATLPEDADVPGWVFTIARHAAIDHLRKKRVGDELDVETTAGNDLTLEVSESLERRARLVLGHWLAASIEQLDEPYRSALTRVELEGMSQRDAAAELGISYSAVKSRVQRGRAKLRQALLRCCEVELDRRGGVVDFRPRTSCCD